MSLLRSLLAWSAPLALSWFTLWPAAAAAAPEDDLAGAFKLALGTAFVADWRGIEKLPGSRWAPLPPVSLDNCLPDGGCFTRQGQVTIGGRPLGLIASGARTIVRNLYLRNGAAPFGEDALLAALKRAGVATELVRCPVPGSKGGQNWYRLQGARLQPGILAVQSSCNGKPCEGFVLTLDDALPPLQPQQLRLYSEQCAAGGGRKAVSTSLPHLELATTLATLMGTAGAAPGWKALPGVAPLLKWDPAGPKKVDLSAFKNDPNPYSMGGTATLAGRTYHLLASGTPTQAQTFYFDEAQLHRPGEDLLAALRAQGLTVQLVRCGPVYTESINNWYRVTGPQTRPAMLQQSIRRDGKQLQDAYVLRLDATLPRRDARDRDPGTAGCK